MDLSKLCIDPSSNEDSEISNYFQCPDRFGNDNQNVNTKPSSVNKMRQNNQEDHHSTLNSYNRTHLKHVIEQCAFLQKDILKYQSQPFTEEIRSTMLNHVYEATAEMLDTLKFLEESQYASLHSEQQYNNINEYSIIRQARNLNDMEGPKYKRRSKRSMVGQYCHSCKTTETPEWRRGPDGARTLCNACGLHYSKLLRKGSLTVQTHSYSIESPSTYQQIAARRTQQSESSRNPNYLPPMNNSIVYKNKYIENWKS